MKIADAKISGVLARPAVKRMTRRTYPRQFKREVVAQCLAPGASVSAVALSHGINANVIRKWLPQGDLRIATGTATMLPVRRVNQDEKSASIKVRRMARAGGWRA